jgi:acyl-CoA thioester hydrolase
VTAVFEYRLRVGPEDLDALDHVNNLRYLAWMERAALGHSAAQGWDFERTRAAGVAWVVRSHAIDYHKPARRDDPIVVRTWVADMRAAASLRRFQILRESDGAVLADARTDYAMIDPSTQSPRRIPPELAGAFEIVPDATPPRP